MMMNVDEMLKHLSVMKGVYERAYKNVNRKRSWRVSEKAMARMEYFKKIEALSVAIELVQLYPDSAQQIYTSRNQEVQSQIQG